MASEIDSDSEGQPGPAARAVACAAKQPLGRQHQLVQEARSGQARHEERHRLIAHELVYHRALAAAVCRCRCRATSARLPLCCALPRWAGASTEA
jgi:hypothetical protein